MPRKPSAAKRHRQGDIYLKPIDKLPEGAVRQPRQGGRIVLAEGEATGHAHAIRARYATAYAIGALLYLRVTRPVALLYEEHEHPDLIDPGIYVVKRQREYSPGELPRQVVD